MQTIDEQIQLEISPILEVGFVAAFADGRREKFGQIPLQEPELAQPLILKQILDFEPSLREASYIMGMIRIKQSLNSTYVATIEYTRQDIQELIKKLIRPGIIMR